MFLLLKINSADGDSVDETPVDEAPADEAPADEYPTHEVPTDEDPVASIDEDPADEDPENSANTVLSLSTKTGSREVEMQVSSKHLSLASKVFEAMFHSKSLEGISSNNRELVTIPLLDDDFHSLQILLNIVHGLTRRVPRQVKRRTLLQAVILIDKYEFHEVAEVFTDMWFECLRRKMPQNLHQDLASFLGLHLLGAWKIERIR